MTKSKKITKICKRKKFFWIKNRMKMRRRKKKLSKLRKKEIEKRVRIRVRNPHSGWTDR